MNPIQIIMSNIVYATSANPKPMFSRFNSNPRPPTPPRIQPPNILSQSSFPSLSGDSNVIQPMVTWAPKKKTVKSPTSDKVTFEIHSAFEYTVAESPKNKKMMSGWATVAKTKPKPKPQPRTQPKPQPGSDTTKKEYIFGTNKWHLQKLGEAIGIQDFDGKLREICTKYRNEYNDIVSNKNDKKLYYLNEQRTYHLGLNIAADMGRSKQIEAFITLLRSKLGDSDKADEFINKPLGKWTALQRAVFNAKSLPSVKILIAMGANPDEKQGQDERILECLKLSRDELIGNEAASSEEKILSGKFNCGNY